MKPDCLLSLTEVTEPELSFLRWKKYSRLTLYQKEQPRICLNYLKNVDSTEKYWRLHWAKKTP